MTLEISISPEILEDSKWVLEELGRTGFAEYDGNYVTILDKKIVGSGDNETELRKHLVEKYRVSPGRFVVEYKGPWT